MQYSRIKTECCLCGRSDGKPAMEKNDATILRCLTDGMIFLADRPSDKTLEAFYESSYFTSDRDKSDIGADYITDYPQMKYNSTLRLEKILKLKDLVRSRLLDVGCAAGAFVEAASEFGCLAYGVDISKFATDFAKGRGLNVYQGVDPRIVKDHDVWDIVTLWHVLEHVPDPKGLLMKVSSRMQQGSLLVVELPNVSSLPAILLKERWKMISPEEHIWYFSPQTLSALLSHCGFRVVRTDFTSFTNLLSTLKRIDAQSALSMIKRNLAKLGWIKKLVGEAKTALHLHDCITVYAYRQVNAV